MRASIDMATFVKASASAEAPADESASKGAAGLEPLVAAAAARALRLPPEIVGPDVPSLPGARSLFRQSQVPDLRFCDLAPSKRRNGDLAPASGRNADLTPGAERVEIVHGDLALPWAGLSDRDWGELVARTDAVCHV